MSETIPSNRSHFPEQVESILMESQFEHARHFDVGVPHGKDAHFRVIGMIHDARTEVVNEAKLIPTAGTDFLRPLVDLEQGVEFLDVSSRVD